MAVDNLGSSATIWSFTAGADLSSAQYKFVEMDSAGLVTVCNAATDKPIGVLQNKPLSGQTAQVLIAGISKVQADAALTIGTEIGTSADGQADAKIRGTDVTEYISGVVLTAASNAGELVTCLINCVPPVGAVTGN
jgi:hypothetical protein